jgi:CMP-N-acetylneuraminic acid synthetase
MILGRHLLVVVPARGGSKGLPRKNLQPFLGRPLVAHTGSFVAGLDWVDRAVVSTDDEEIAATAEASGLAAPFRRPAALSGDRIGDWDVLHHALLEAERLDARTYDIVVMLQPTCPLRQPEHVLTTVRRLVDGGWDAVWTVSPTDLHYHPLKALTIGADGAMEHFDPRGAEVVARQQLQPVFHRNGAAYAVTRECLVTQRTIKGRRSSAVVISDPLVNIDSLDDLRRAEAMASRSRRRSQT